jgi:hypothetical protein
MEGGRTAEGDLRREKEGYARRGRRDNDVIARETQNPGNRSGEERWTGNLEWLDALLRLRCGGFVAMLHPHARGVGLGNARVVEIMRELVSVTGGANRQRKREESEDRRMEKLPDGDLNC